MLGRVVFLRAGRAVLLVAMTLGTGACPPIRADVERLAQIRERPLYRVTCPGVVTHDCSIKIGELCKYGNYRLYHSLR